MKKEIITLILYFFLVVGSAQQNILTLVQNNQSEYSIVVSEEADSLSLTAATEMQAYFRKTSGVKLDILNHVQPGKNHLCVGKIFEKDSAALDRLQNSKEDAFVIKTKGGDVLLYGKNSKTNLYAVYTFIEEVLGCQLLSVDEEYIPTNQTIEMEAVDKLYEPAFSFRRTLFPGQADEKYQYWHKIEPLDEWGMFVHTFQHLIPPEKYFEEHPEYFSLIEGRRLSDAQLCLSNPEVIRLLKENLASEMAKQPAKKYWSVSQNDCINYCTCDGCNTLYKKYGGYSGAYILMANELAKAFPDKQISTLAYQFTRSAPKNIVPLENVNIMFCSIECNRSMPLKEDRRSASFVKDMEDWAKITNNIFLWDYVVQFKNYLCPFPNFHVLQPNIQFFKENGVDMMFQQGSNRNWSDLSDLKQYLIAKLLWDPDLNPDELIVNFLENYYGPAHHYIKEYFDLTHQNLIQNQESEFLNIYGFPTDYADSYLTPPLLNQYRSLMDQAENAVQKDSIYLKRVYRARLPVDFAYIDIALNNDFDEVSFFDKKEGQKELRSDMVDYLHRLGELSKITETTRINERNFQIEEYIQYVLRKVTWMNKDNLAKGKKLKLLTRASEKYPVGEEAALTDGLFGDLDFNNNWLGFEGEDMIVEIDLSEKIPVSKVNMHFLKAVNSWIFLPEKVKVELSEDGVNYYEAGSIEGDQSDRNYLVKSIPFEIATPKTEARYVRITATSMKTCPSWHRGYGNPSWIFIDEVIVE